MGYDFLAKEKIYIGKKINYIGKEINYIGKEINYIGKEKDYIGKENIFTHCSSSNQCRIIIIFLPVVAASINRLPWKKCIYKKTTGAG